MELKPLHADTLRATQRVAAALFPWEHEHQEALPASLNPEGHRDFFSARRLDSVRCWTAGTGGDVGGMAMLYGYKEQLDELWLAWFGLTEDYRGQGRGSRLLDWVVGLARQEGRKTLRLWTTDEEEYAAAVGLYTRRGFIREPAPLIPGETWNTFVFSLGLDGKIARPWVTLPHSRELCGREMPLLAANAA